MAPRVPTVSQRYRTMDGLGGWLQELKLRFNVGEGKGRRMIENKVVVDVVNVDVDVDRGCGTAKKKQDDAQSQCGG